jgi:hypothetical protein
VDLCSFRERELDHSRERERELDRSWERERELDRSRDRERDRARSQERNRERDHDQDRGRERDRDREPRREARESSGAINDSTSMRHKAVCLFLSICYLAKFCTVISSMVNIWVAAVGAATVVGKAIRGLDGVLPDCGVITGQEGTVSSSGAGDSLHATFLPVAISFVAPNMADLLGSPACLPECHSWVSCSFTGCHPYGRKALVYFIFTFWDWNSLSFLPFVIARTHFYSYVLLFALIFVVVVERRLEPG